MSQGLLIIGASLSHPDKPTPHSVGLLWTSDQPDAQTSTCTTHNTHNRQTSMPLVGFEPAIPARERPQTHALDDAANGIGQQHDYTSNMRKPLISLTLLKPSVYYMYNQFRNSKNSTLYTQNVFMCFVWISNKQRLFPCTSISS